MYGYLIKIRNLFFSENPFLLSVCLLRIRTTVYLKIINVNLITLG